MAADRTAHPDANRLLAARDAAPWDEALSDAVCLGVRPYAELPVELWVKQPPARLSQTAELRASVRLEQAEPPRDEQVPPREPELAPEPEPQASILQARAEPGLPQAWQQWVPAEQQVERAEQQPAPEPGAAVAQEVAAPPGGARPALVLQPLPLLL
jgi:hypothetical protein